MEPPESLKRYLAVPPAPPLRPFVECLWVTSIAGSEPGDDRRILPDGRMDLVWIRELARAAAAAGYADQSHLTRESRRLAGLSPRQLVAWMG